MVANPFSKDKGSRSQETVVYTSSPESDPARADELLGRVRRSRGIEGGLHQRLDMSGGEGASRVRNCNAILTPGHSPPLRPGHPLPMEEEAQEPAAIDLR